MNALLQALHLRREVANVGQRVGGGQLVRSGADLGGARVGWCLDLRSRS